MNQHPYLRAYMAGIAVPTAFMLLVLAAFCIVRFGYGFPAPMERIIVFPMTVVPNAFGAWNMLYVAQRSRHRRSVGLHGALLPFILAPLGFLLATTLGFAVATPRGLELVYLGGKLIPYWRFGVFFPVALVVYYLIWKYLVGFLNELLGIAD